MKILCISDTHTKHDQIINPLINNPDRDIDTIVCAGDVSSRGYKQEIKQFLDWYSKLKFENKILIAGNHDFFFEQGQPEDIAELLANYPSVTYLNDSGVEIDGIKFWGSPVQPWFFNWAFNRVDRTIIKHWDMIPLDTDVLITHGPIKGFVDRTRGGEHVGCPYLLEKVMELKDLKLHVCGHIHEAYGEHTFVNGAKFVNASVLNLNYTMAHNPILIEINKNEN